MKTFIKLFTFLIAAVIFTGCSSQVYNLKSLKQNNRFAVVSITGLSSGFGMSEEEENKLVTSAGKLALKELKGSKHFKLANQNKILRDKYYRAIKAESTDGLLTVKSAKGYKKFDFEDEKQNLTNLMKRQKLTGVIQIMSNYNKDDSGFTLSGILPIPIPVTAGKTSGKVITSIVVTDINHQIIWQDAIQTETKDSVGSIMGVANTKKLYPQLLEATQEGVNKALKALDEKMSQS